MQSVSPHTGQYCPSPHPAGRASTPRPASLVCRSGPGSSPPLPRLCRQFSSRQTPAGDGRHLEGGWVGRNKVSELELEGGGGVGPTWSFCAQKTANEVLAWISVAKMHFK